MPGLREEEVALLAGLSADHYSRLEQGRQAFVADDVLEALAGALRLDDVERAHLRDLAATRRSRPAVWEAGQQPDPGLLRLLTALDHVPALLLGRRGEVLARNVLLVTVLGATLPPGSSFVTWLFLEPGARARIVNWPVFAAAAVGALRYEAGRHPHDPRLAQLVATLRRADPDVDRWWRDQRVVDRTSVRKHVAHPAAGTLTFDIEAVSLPHDPEQRLVVYTVEPDSPTARVLPLLAGWQGDEATEVQPAP